MNDKSRTALIVVLINNSRTVYVLNIHVMFAAVLDNRSKVMFIYLII